MKTYHPLLALWLLQLGAAQAVVYVDGSSDDWTPMAGVFDFLVDQQTGLSSSDIVGDAQFHPGFLVVFNDNGDASSIDGQIGFRVRLDQGDGNTSNPGFGAVLWVGIDADPDTAAAADIDVFLGVNLKGGKASSYAIEMRDPGTEANISPSTTSVGDVAYTYPLSINNFSYRPVNPQSDGGTLADLTTGTANDPDYYLSFMVPFADIVNYLENLPTPINITDTTPLRFVVATSNQENSLNQDLGGIPKTFDGAQSWETLGGFTQSFSPVPEPSASFLLLGSLAAGCLRRRR